MEKASKYYTPGIEEFCVGFEYEYLASTHNTEWEKITASWEDLDLVFDDYEHEYDGKFHELYRVKYLDEQDIIDCGFVKSTGLYNLKCYNYRDCRIYPDFNEENHYFIKYLSGYFSDSEVQLFAGFIKNKHELKTVLKMIGVYE